MSTLPERVYFKHGAYYYVTPANKWVRLGHTEDLALAEYSRLAAAPDALSTMSKVFDKYLIEVVPLKAERTQQDNRKELANLRAVFGAMRPVDVKPRHVAQYLSVRKAKVRGNREVALLSHIFKKALNWGVVEMNPCHGIERNEEQPRDRLVTDQELATFKTYCPTWLVNYLDLKYLTGLRQSDLLRLTHNSVTSRGLELQIRKSGRGVKRRGMSRVIFTITPELERVLASVGSYAILNTGKRHTAPKVILTAPYTSPKVISTAPSKCLERTTCRGHADSITPDPTQSSSTTLFLTSRGTAYSTSSFASTWRRAWARVRKGEVELEYFREHDIRAKTATDAQDQGQDATALLGHTDKKTTRAYLRGRAATRIQPLK